MVKKVVALLLAGLMVLCAVACASTGKKEQASASDASGAASGTFTASGKTLNVGVQSSTISVPVVYAAEKGYYKELGLDVNLIIFPNGSPENEGLAAEQLDVASNGLASVYSMAAGVCDFIGETDSASASLRIYAKADSPIFEHKGEIDGKPNMYGSVDTLKGLTFLGQTSTIEQWAALAYMSQFGLVSGEDFEYLNMDRAAAVQAIIAGQGDLFVATDVNYCNMMEEAGFKVVADCMEATGTEFRNGYLARKAILEERYDDVVLFLKGTYKAAVELQGNPEVRNAFAYKYYSDNGKENTEADVAEEARLRPFILPEEMLADNYVMGSGALQVGEFFASIGTIEADQIETLRQSVNPKPLRDALGLDIKSVD